MQLDGYQLLCLLTDTAEHLIVELPGLVQMIAVQRVLIPLAQLVRFVQVTSKCLTERDLSQCLRSLVSQFSTHQCEEWTTSRLRTRSMMACSGASTANMPSML